jgi:two-component system, cell cycle sensor histidine kinase and response regulator CckA
MAIVRGSGWLSIGCPTPPPATVTLRMMPDLPSVAPLVFDAHVHEEAVRADDARRFQAALSDLSTLNRSDVRATFAAIAAVAAKAMEVERVSLWQYDTPLSAMTCRGAYERGVLVDEALLISRDAHPAYWSALQANRTLAIADATTDPALAEMRDDYIVPRGVGALIDSAIRVEQTLFGIVCVEHTGAAREWSLLEQYFVASLADRMGLAILLDTQRRLEDELLHARKTEAIGLMAGGVAHDYNNVLSIVLSAASSLRLSVNDAVQRTRDLETIDAAVGRAAALTRKLLFLGRNEILVREPFDLNDALRAFAVISERVRHPGVTSEMYLAEAPLPIIAERTFVDQALLNLWTNAVQALPDGGTICATTELLVIERPRRVHGVELPVGRFAQLSVRDTGSGVAAGDLPRVFDPFFTTKGVSGTGLGLSVIAGGMRQHGGFISVESDEGRGSTFRLFFPLQA